MAYLHAEENEPEAVNPVPRTYVRGFEVRPFVELQNNHPRIHVRGVLWYGVKPESHVVRQRPGKTRN
ncbi:MAG: hypothetical protein V3T60_15945 [Candidatus Binatia bacterium]